MKKNQSKFLMATGVLVALLGIVMAFLGFYIMFIVYEIAKNSELPDSDYIITKLLNVSGFVVIIEGIYMAVLGFLNVINAGDYDSKERCMKNSLIVTGIGALDLLLIIIFSKYNMTTAASIIISLPLIIGILSVIAAFINKKSLEAENND